MKEKNWYEEAIEEPIRPLVKLLRENGFNTTCSCGHEMYVELEFYFDEDITRLHDLLWENGYRHFRISAYWEVRESFTWKKRDMRLELLQNKDGEIKK